LKREDRIPHLKIKRSHPKIRISHRKIKISHLKIRISRQKIRTSRLKIRIPHLKTRIPRLKLRMQFAIIISLLLAANAAHGSRRGNFVPTNTCSPAHQAAVWDSVVGCQPRPTLIELEFPDSDVTGDGSVMHIMPGHAVIDRCSGKKEFDIYLSR
jgi:hypothetical protein